MMSLSDDRQADIMDAFNTTSRYLDDILKINNVYFDTMVKVSKGAKIRNRYNQVPLLTKDTNGKVTNSQSAAQTRTKWSTPFQQVTTRHICQIYPSELQLNKANTSDTKAAFLDLHWSISNDSVLPKFMIKVMTSILKLSISHF